ncbi:MAG: DedA family protein [Arsenophonus endosymbiont of Ceratovacuna japonica]
MFIFNKIIMAIWNHDFSKLINLDVLWIIYTALFIIIILENSILPASFLPGDTLLVLSGALIEKGILSFIPTIIILTIASSLGYWLGFLQGRWFNDKYIVKQWIQRIPIKYYNSANRLFNNKGLYALLIGRFLVFIRTILPILAGLSTLNHKRFQLFNWISGLLWVSIMIYIGYAINKINFFKYHENLIINILILLPILLFIIGFISIFIALWKSKKNN